MKIDYGFSPGEWDIKYTDELNDLFSRCVVTDEFIFMSQKDFDNLSRRDWGSPTGKYSGKHWKSLWTDIYANKKECWMFINYGPANVEYMMRLFTRKLYILAGDNEIPGG